MNIEWRAVCQSCSHAQQFGLCDDEDLAVKTPAYISDDRAAHQWIAVVNNPSGMPVHFTAVDNCISMLRPNGEMESRCDGFLTYESTIIFVELKEKRRKWASGGFEQIAVTVAFLALVGLLAQYAKRKAYVANRRKQLIPYTNLAMQEMFDLTYGMAVHAENVIPIV